MRSETQRSTSYFRQVLRDGAIPFVYREGVRTLLDLPEQTEVFPQGHANLPPPGFRYSKEPFNSLTNVEPSEAPVDWLEKGHGELDTTTTTTTDQSNITSTGCQDPPTSLGVIEHGFNTVVEDTAHESHVHGVTESRLPPTTTVVNTNSKTFSEKQLTLPVHHKLKDDKIFGVDTNSTDKAEINQNQDVESARLEIPGSTDSPQLFIATTLPLDQPVASAHTKIEVGRPILRNGETKVFNRTVSTDAVGRNRDTALASTFSDVGTEARKQYEKKKVIPSKKAVDIVQNRNTPTRHEKSKRSDVLTQSPTAKFLSESKVDLAPQVVAGKRPFPLRKTDNTIDQLRRSVDELMTELAALKTKTDSQQTTSRADQPMSSPAQQTVVIRQSANPSSTPRAFWERCYLGRFSLRAIR